MLVLLRSMKGSSSCIAGGHLKKLSLRSEQVVETQAVSEAAQQMAIGSQQTVQSAAEIASVTEEAAASTQDLCLNGRT